MNQELIADIKLIFEERFQNPPLLVSSPGRINLIGEHTDYNGGFVFPATIDKYIITGISINNLNHCRIYACDMDDTLEVDLSNIEVKESGSWKNYVIGVIAGLVQRGYSIGNFDMAFKGDIPIGAGLSSSAALENSIVFGLNEMFKLDISKNKMMEISVKAEHDFAGVECGIMDQFSNLNGEEGKALFLNCSTMNFEYVPIELKDYELLLINTNVKHKLSDSPFNKRKQECVEGLDVLRQKFPRLNHLSDANTIQLDEVKGNMSSIVYNRSLFVIKENERVKSSKIAIENMQWTEFGKSLFASHSGLKNLYNVSCDELDFLVDLAKSNGVAGSRMMGGGFGGCTLNLIKKSQAKEFVKMAENKYSKKFGFKVSTYLVNVSEGIKVI